MNEYLLFALAIFSFAIAIPFAGGFAARYMENRENENS